MVRWLIETLLPFFVEVFFKNDEVKHTIKTPRFLVRLVLFLGVVISLMFGLYQALGEIAVTTHSEYDDVSRDYRELEKTYRESVELRYELENKLAIRRTEIRDIRKVLESVTDELAEKKEAAQALKDRLSDVVEKNQQGQCVYMGGTWESQVNSLLEQID